jgi:CRISPR-associated endonuclease Cas1 subtype I-F
MAKQLMVFRMKYTDKMSLSSSPIDEDDIERHIKNINKAKSFKELLELEEVTIKNEFYHKYAARYLGSSLQRNGDGKSISPEQEKVNTLLSAGNDLVRGLAANAIWSMGLSPALTLLKDRKNGSSLIYDVADLVKDVLVLPWAFEYSKSTKKDALAQLRYLLKRKKADQAMVDGIKLVCGIK